MGTIRQHIRLDTARKNGTLRSSLESAVRQLRKAGRTDDQLREQFPELQQIELLPGTETVLQTFAELSATRGHGMNGPLAITHVEMKAYCELMDKELSPWEVETVRAMDAAFLEETYKIAAEETGQ